MAELLHRVGYASFCVGKYHLGTHPKHHPLRRGFDHFYGFLSGGHRYLTSELTLQGLDDVTSFHEWYYTKLIRDYTVVDHYANEYLTDELTDAAICYITNHTASSVVMTPSSEGTSDSHHIASATAAPFFLYLAYNAPHSPRRASDAYIERFAHMEWSSKRRVYAAVIATLDDNIGRVTEVHGALMGMALPSLPLARTHRQMPSNGSLSAPQS